MQTVGNNLLNNVEFVKHLNMKKDILEGKRLSIGKMSKLAECCKINYINEILLYDDKVSRQIA